MSGDGIAMRVVAHPTPQDDWVHRFRNFGEAAWVALRTRCDISIEEIDASFDTFLVGGIAAGELSPIVEELARMLDEHYLVDDVFLVRLPDDSAADDSAIIVVLDPLYGERLFPIAGHDVWIVGSDVNRAAAKELREPSITTWSQPQFDLRDASWVRGVVETIELHHGEWSSERPVNRLSVYGAEWTQEIAAAFAEEGYGLTIASRSGFIAMKRGMKVNVPL